MLSRLAEHDVRPTLRGQIEVHPGRCNVHELIAVIPGQVVMGFLLEVRKHLLIVADNPARRRDVDGFELAFNLVLILEPMRDDIELQRTDGTENQVVIPQGLE